MVLLFFQNYTLTVNVFDAEDTNIQSAASITIEVQSSDLIARIAGMKEKMSKSFCCYTSCHCGGEEGLGLALC